MKKVIITFVCLCFSVALVAQNKGIEFQNMPIEKLFEMAEAENKIIYLNFGAKWCAPCQKMKKEVFTNPDLGEYMNAKFCSILLDTEKRAGKILAAMYDVNALPTHIVIDPKGRELYRHVGELSLSDFSSSMRTTTRRIRESNIEKMRNQYESKKNDVDFIASYLTTLNSNYMTRTYDKVKKEFFRDVKNGDYYSPKYWSAYIATITDVESEEYKKIINHLDRVKGDKLEMLKSGVQSIMKRVLYDKLSKPQSTIDIDYEWFKKVTDILLSDYKKLNIQGDLPPYMIVASIINASVSKDSDRYISYCEDYLTALHFDAKYLSNVLDDVSTLGKAFMIALESFGMEDLKKISPTIMKLENNAKAGNMLKSSYAKKGKLFDYKVKYIISDKLLSR